MEFPEYRRAFTKSSSITVVQIKDGSTGDWQVETVKLDIEMPKVHLSVKDENGEKKAKYVKYLEPSEFNVLIQNKF